MPNLTVDQLHALYPGQAASAYGFDAGNILDPNRYLGKFRNDWSRGIKSGGNEQVYSRLYDLGTKYGSKQAFTRAPAFKGQQAELRQYLDTGDVKGLDPRYAAKAYDYALRDTGRDAVRDREPGLLGTIASKVIGPAVGYATGNPWIGALAGGAAGGGLGQGGLKNALLGAAGGGLAGYFSDGLGALKIGGQNAAPIVDKSLASGAGAWTRGAPAGFDAWSPGAFSPTVPAASASTFGATDLWNAGGSWTPGGAWTRTTPPEGFNAWTPGLDGAQAAVSAGKSWLTPQNALRGASLASDALGLLSGGTALPVSQTSLYSPTSTLTALPLAGGGSNPVTDRFNYALTDALTGNAGSTSNALARSSMGAGKVSLSPRDMQRQSGYQTRPVGNFLAR